MCDTAQGCSVKVDAESKLKKSNESQIPIPSPTHFTRTGSLKLRNETRLSYRHDSTSTPNVPLRRHSSLHGLTSPILMRRAETIYKDDDLDSEKSFGSSCSSVCGHSTFAHNGTTFSARNKKYIFHCSPGTGSEEYLTPTQRANRTIKRLRRMLTDAQSELIEKEQEICRLTKEIVELRLVKSSNAVAEGSSYEMSDEIDFPELISRKSSPKFMEVLLEEHDSTVTDNHEPHEAGNVLMNNRQVDNRSDLSLQLHIPQSPSLADSGNFEDINCSYSHNLEREMEKLRQNYEELRGKHNEKVEQLLKIIAESNDKYYDVKPKYDDAVLKIKELEKENDALKSAVSQQEELQKTLYLQLYSKQEQTERRLSDIEKNVPPLVQDVENPSQMSDILKNLSITKKELESIKVMYRALLEANKMRTVNDAEMTLQFLKTAIFYFLTDTTNCRDHLAAIQSILGFSDDEKAKIDKVQAWK